MFAVVRGLCESAICKTLVPLAFALTLAGCGSSRSMNPMPSPSPSQPSQPNYPSTPPVAITWSPTTSLLPAPPACDPPQSTCDPPYPSGSDNFPLTVSSPTDQSTVTSPMHVVASASPKNPLFFMRVYVDQLAVYFTFTNSIDTQIFVASGQHKIEVMAEDNQGYVSDTILNVNVAFANGQDHDQWNSKHARMAILLGRFSCGLWLRWPTLRRGKRQSTDFIDDRGPNLSGFGWPICEVQHERTQRLCQHALFQSHQRWR